MFRVFSKYNALFVRPKIRGAIQEYQTQLIENVKADIAALHDRFKLQYGNSEAHAMAQLRDLPPISGAIIWARQIERQLNTYMRRVEDVLGKGWELYAEGQKLQNESIIFRKKLDTRAVILYNGFSNPRFMTHGYKMLHSDSLQSPDISSKLFTTELQVPFSCKSSSIGRLLLCSKRFATSSGSTSKSRTQLAMCPRRLSGCILMLFRSLKPYVHIHKLFERLKICPLCQLCSRAFAWKSKTWLQKVCN